MPALSFALSLFIVPLWIVAALGAESLGWWNGVRRLRAVTVVTLLVTLAALAGVAGKLAIVAWLWSQDARLVVESPLTMLVLLIPVVSVLLLSAPSLIALLRSLRGADHLTVDIRERTCLPLLVTPIVTGAFAMLAWFVLYWTMAGTMSPQVSAFTAVALIATIVANAFRQLGRQRRLRPDGGHTHPALAGRLTRAGVVGVLGIGGLAALVARGVIESRLPGAYAMGPAESADVASPHAHDGHGDGWVRQDADGNIVSVTTLAGPQDGEPDQRFELTARQAEIALDNGERLHGWTFNGEAPGPELRVREGDLVEVVLRNEDIEDGVTIHWHGYNVPCAEDGVAGVTQDAVLPGETHTYRFTGDQVGTYWYHSHQVSSEQVRRGLWGPLIVEPRDGAGMPDLDVVVPIHSWSQDGDPGQAETSFDLNSGETFQQTDSGTRVRLRVINTDFGTVTVTLAGVAGRVVAIDGVDVNDPDELSKVTAFALGGGARHDLEFTMPDAAVSLTTGDNGPVLKFAPEEGMALPDRNGAEAFDALSYGQPAETPIDADTAFDKEFEMVLGERFGFYDGIPTYIWTINGHVFPDIPSFHVAKGDRVKVSFIHQGLTDHPMHLHGHHLLVLEKNGERATGSPWWVDTLLVRTGDRIEAAFIADNKGIWMDHCHDLFHAANGMSTHLVYNGVTTPFMAGRDTVNQPE